MTAPEAHFALLWQAAGGPELINEFKFHPTRKWRADFAHMGSKTLIEIEGGVHSGGRHTRGSGFSKDAEKYLEAFIIAGWNVVRLVPSQLNLPTIERIISCLPKNAAE